MKKILSMVLALTLLLVSFAGCGDNSGSSAGTASGQSSAVSGTSGTSDGEPLKIGVLAPAVTHGWISGVAHYAEARCEELKGGKDGKAPIEYRFLTCSNAEEMTTNLDNLKTWGAQAIVAYPQWEGMEVPIQQAIDEGIKVVNFDIEIDADGVYRVSGDNEDMGIQSAQYIVDKIGKSGTVVVLNVPSAGSVSELREKGFMDKIKEIAPDMDIQTFPTQFNREAGLKDFTDILTKLDHIDAVYSMDDETSIGVLNAIKEANRTDIKVVTGGGGSQEYFKMMPENKDIWIQSALYSPTMVMDAVDMAYDLLTGEEAEQVKIIPTTIVDRDNYQDFLDENSPY